MKRSLALAALLLLALSGFWYFENRTSQDSETSLTSLELDGTETALSPSAAGALQPAATPETGVRTLAVDSSAKPEEAEAEAPDRIKAAPKGPFLTGTVVDRDGVPISEVEVEVTGRLTGTSLIDLGEMLLSETATTDRYGRFRVSRGHWPKFEVMVKMSGRGYLLAEKTAIPGEDSGDSSLGFLELETGVVLGGQVLDSEGSPLAGAEVWRTSGGGSGNMPMMFAMANRMGRFGGGTQTTGEDGRFLLEHEKPGEYTLHVEHEDFPKLDHDGMSPPAGTEDLTITVRLAPGATISGRIIGMPPLKKGVSIQASPPGTEEAERGASFAGIFGGGMGNLHKVTPDRDGSFVLRGLEVGKRYAVQGFLKDGILANLPCSEEQTVLAGASDLRFTWESGASITFLVSEALTGKAVPPGEVRYRWTDAEGGPLANARKLVKFSGERVTINDLKPSPSPGHLELAVTVDGYLQERVENISVSDLEKVDLGTITLRVSPTLRVQVIEASTGKPIRRARVVLLPEETEGGRDFFGLGGTHSSGKTDKQGWCELDVCSTKFGTLVVSRKGFAAFELEELAMPTSAGHSEVIKLHPGGRIEVSVVDSDRSPATGMSVVHKSPDGSTDSRETSQDGTVMFKDLPAGEHSFRARKASGRRGGMRVRAGRNSGEEDEFQVVLLAAGGESALSIVLDPTTTLSGIVTQRGVPVAQARVTLYEGETISEGDRMRSGMNARMAQAMGAGAPSTTTDGEGRFTIEKVALGKHQLAVKGKQGAADHYTSVDLDLGSNHVNVELPNSSVEGAVVDDEGHAIATAKVRLLRVSEEDDEASEGRQAMAMMSSMFGAGGATGNRCDHAGEYTIEGIPIGQACVVEASAKGYVTGRSESFEANPDQVVHAKRIVLTRAGTIKVRVAGTMFKPVYGRRVAESGPGPGSSVALINEGAAKLADLGPGEWIVSMEKNGPGQSVMVIPGAEVEVLLDQ